MKYAIIYGSYREGRTGIRAVRYLQKKLKERGHETVFVDAQEENLPMLEKRMSDYEEGQAPEKLQKLADLFGSVDGFVIVAGEYNHSVQPGLKNLLDYFLKEYFWRPSAIVSYSVGRIAGQRVAVHLRAILGELGMPSISSMLSIGEITKNLDEEGSDLNGIIDKSSGKFLDELDWYAEALKGQKSKGTPY